MSGDAPLPSPGKDSPERSLVWVASRSGARWDGLPPPPARLGGKRAEKLPNLATRPGSQHVLPWHLDLDGFVSGVIDALKVKTQRH